MDVEIPERSENEVRGKRVDSGGRWVEIEMDGQDSSRGEAVM